MCSVSGPGDLNLRPRHDIILYVHVCLYSREKFHTIREKRVTTDEDITDDHNDGEIYRLTETPKLFYTVCSGMAPSDSRRDAAVLITCVENEERNRPKGKDTRRCIRNGAEPTKC